MSKLRVVQIQFVSALVVVTLLATTLVAVVAASPISSRLASPDAAQATSMQSATMSLSLALGENRPMVIVFTPVEQCRIQYCVTADLVAERLGDQEINVVAAPVYAVPMQSDAASPTYPMIDWGVYMVEPFASWLPEFTEGIFGYGLDATAVALVNANGQVVISRQHLIDIDSFVKEAIVYSTTPSIASQ